MSIHLRTGEVIYPIGEYELTISFFDTIHCLLEKGTWGDTYPTLMQDLYAGKVAWKNMPKLKAELEEIRLKLSAFPPSALVWDRKDRSKRPPWGDKISKHITDMSKYYVTAYGRDFFDVFNAAMEYAMKYKTDLRLESTYQEEDEPDE